MSFLSWSGLLWRSYRSDLHSTHKRLLLDDVSCKFCAPRLLLCVVSHLIVSGYLSSAVGRLVQYGEVDCVGQAGRYVACVHFYSPRNYL